ncbi:PorP/SprF family type IX secretion system membrane protein [Maribellus sediminis]|uniref:PorP/SprF family type IX secretion system membrane protein n=1 Tax=Maribellus sediminis TaxID=2696285 RepID=UPI00142F5056|nr:PorP/SprF family type IX secretion system membrane protein [Maribellus sediminis]
MRFRRHYLVVFIFAIAFYNSKGQDVSFSQFYANPLYLNPAFAGSSGVPRVSVQYRKQWHAFNNAFTTYSTSIDFPVEKLRGGIGLYLMNDLQADGALNAYQVNALYAVSVQMTEEFRMNAGIQVGFNQNTLGISRLIFADNIDVNFGNHGVSGELAYLTDPDYSYFDLGTGFLIYNERYFGGFSIDHLAEPYQSYTSNSESGTKLKRKYTAHLGARLPVYLNGHYRKKFDISPQLIVQSQGVFHQINYGLLAAKRGLAVGTWFRQNFGLRYDAVILLIGFVRNKWQFTYSYDLVVSGLSGQSGGTSEVSLVFMLSGKKKANVLPFYEQYNEKFGEM